MEIIDLHSLKCYLPDKDELWLPGELISYDKSLRTINAYLEEENGDKKQITLDLNDKLLCQILNISMKQPIETQDDLYGIFPLQNISHEGSEEELNGTENMITLNHLHEAAILYNIKKRFLIGLPYTYTGDICIAVNPYRWIPDLYDDATRMAYNRGMDTDGLKPHAYKISMRSYYDMRNNKKNQSILVSGESGAGKTETTKLLMNHLATIGNKDVNDTIRTGETIEYKDETIEKIIQVNPLLESFGNAKTVRNDNSSRFGKFTCLQFNKRFHLIGAKCQTYLLEKTRVIQQEWNEQNYHIFYQLLGGAAELFPTGADLKQFHFVWNQSKNENDTSEEPREEIDMIKKGEEYKSTMSALSLIGLTEDQRSRLCHVLAGILYLGQLHFEVAGDDDEVSRIVQESVIAEVIGDYLGIEFNQLQKALCSRTVRARSDVYSVPLRVEQAVNCRDALAKSIYAHIFDWLVIKINSSLASSNTRDALYTTSILDIFGFEHFQFNSFEQFCINYANEKLQQKFTKDIFKTVQDEYEAEGIKWSHVNYQDNQRVLNVIEAKMGIIALLNEEAMRPKGNEESFVNKINSLHREDHSDIIQFPKLSKTKFTIVHYAASVSYETVGFLEKHKDALLPDLFELMHGSTNSFISNELFLRYKQGIAAETNSSLLSKTVGTQFKNDLATLMETIEQTKVHYIRCIKPNSMKSSEKMDHEMTINQLRCAGVVEAIKITRMAYPSRLLHSEFVRNYSLAFLKQRCVVDKLSSDEKEALFQRILNEIFKFQEIEDYQIGKTKIYFRKGILEEMEKEKSLILGKYSLVIQKNAKCFVARKRYVRQRDAAIKIQSSLRRALHMKRYHQIRRQIIRLQARYRGSVGRSVARLVLLQSKAIIIACYLKGYHQRSIYQKQRKSCMKIQSVFRMKLLRKKYLALLQEKRLQADLSYQLNVLQRRLQEEQMKNSRIKEERVGNEVGDDKVMADAGGMIKKLQDTVEKLRQESEEQNAENAKLKHEIAALRKEKDLIQATNHMKLRQYEDEIKEKDKKLTIAEKEYKEMRKYIAENASSSGLTPEPKKLGRGLLRSIVGHDSKAEKNSPEFVTSPSAMNYHLKAQKINETRKFLKASAQRMSKAKFWSTPYVDEKVDELSPAASEDIPCDARLSLTSAQPGNAGGLSVSSIAARGVTGAMSTLKSKMAAVKDKYYSESTENSTIGDSGGSFGFHRSVSKKMSNAAAHQDTFNLDCMPENPLPKGWEMRISRSTGKAFYCNRATKEVQWERPTVESLKARKKPKGKVV